MTEFVTSEDGTRIAYDREGDGPAVIFVGGATQFRAFDPTTVELAHQLAAKGFTVVNYDRRGRGESTDRLPFAVEREIEDIAALIEEVGGEAALFGSSSGSALCLWAAAAGVSATKLALWEAPLALEGEGDGGEFLAGLEQRIADGDREGAAEYFMKDMPPEWLEGAKNSPAWPVMQEIAPTLVYDTAALTKAQEAPWAEQWASVTMPTIVITGEETLPIFPPAADALVSALPHARRITIPASNHRWQPEVMVPVLAEFFGKG